MLDFTTFTAGVVSNMPVMRQGGNVPGCARRAVGGREQLVGDVGASDHEPVGEPGGNGARRDGHVAWT